VATVRANACHVDLRGKIKLLPEVEDELKNITNSQKTAHEKKARLDSFVSKYGYFVVVEALIGVAATADFTGEATEEFKSNAMAASMSASMSGGGLGWSASGSAAAGIEKNKNEQLAAVEQHMRVEVMGASVGCTMQSMYKVAEHAGNVVNLATTEIREVETIFDCVSDPGVKEELARILTIGSQPEPGRVYHIRAMNNNLVLQYDNTDSPLVAHKPHPVEAKQCWVFKTVGRGEYSIRRANALDVAWSYNEIDKLVAKTTRTWDRVFHENKFRVRPCDNRPGWFTIIPTSAAPGHAVGLQGEGVTVVVDTDNHVYTAFQFDEIDHLVSSSVVKEVNIYAWSSNDRLLTPSPVSEDVKIQTLSGHDFQSPATQPALWHMVPSNEPGYYMLIDPGSGNLLKVNPNKEESMWLPPTASLDPNDKWAQWLIGHGNTLQLTCMNRFATIREQNNTAVVMNAEYNGQNHYMDFILSSRYEIDPAEDRWYRIFDTTQDGDHFRSYTDDSEPGFEAWGPGIGTETGSWCIEWVLADGDEGWSLYASTYTPDGHKSKKLVVKDGQVELVERDDKVSTDQLFQFDWNPTKRTYQILHVDSRHWLTKGVDNKMIVSSTADEGANFVVLEYWTQD
jgi:hypothetical protein